MADLTNKQWEAQDDARTLARANEIKASPARVKSAAAQAKKMVASESKQLAGLKKVAAVGARKPAPRKK